jgi:hypothetical protein
MTLDGLIARDPSLMGELASAVADLSAEGLASTLVVGQLKGDVTQEDPYIFSRYKSISIKVKSVKIAKSVR